MGRPPKYDAEEQKMISQELADTQSTIRSMALSFDGSDSTISRYAHNQGLSYLYQSEF